ncbi:Hint domain-containing protein [Paragemmobacter straminiformis]|uniref:Hint domain-containing protein n=1 Tax=Paragemmobacter straminiformis TaxID=2045119 RepID=A0A842I849_9RHOB|nr:Hint domain-containing protein [Gemmobacter straminiformis]MBC2835573.1 Hint domain-containing protein [Gemmobacter straminiformis]
MRPSRAIPVRSAASVAYSIQPEPCGLAQGARLLTPFGWCAVEDLLPGDLVTDRDGHATCIAAIETVHVRGRAATVLRVAADACGYGCPERPVLLPHDAAMLVAGDALSLHFGLDEALVPVEALANGEDVAVIELPSGLTWHNLTLERPALLVVDGLLLAQGCAAVPSLSPADGRLLRLSL